MIFFLKDLLSKTENFFYNLYQCTISIVKVIVLSKPVGPFPSADQKECLILGNGPSLNALLKQNELLHRYKLFCVNHFPSTDAFVQCKPSYCVWLDAAFFDTKHPLAEKTLNALIERTTWPLTLFLPVLAKNQPNVKTILNGNANIKIQFFNYTIVDGFKSFSFFFYKKNLGMPLCQNVLGACIFLALNSGYKKLYLYGAEHNWFRNIRVFQDNHLYIIHEHFYSESQKEPLVTPVYKNSSIKEKMPMEEYFVACTKTFRVYTILEKYSKSLQAKIYNTTQDSFIDAFERKKLDIEGND